MLFGMGMSERNVRAALKAKGSLDAAMGWLLGQEDVDAAVAQLEREAEGAREEPEDGAEKYALVGFISHIGRNTGSGHYVCHLQKEANPIFGEIAVSLAGHRERPSSRRSTRRSRTLKMRVRRFEIPTLQDVGAKDVDIMQESAACDPRRSLWLLLGALVLLPA